LGQVKILLTFEWYQDGMDFADAIHLAQSKEVESFVTFDKKLIKSASKTTTLPVREP
jgi:predicted nucleic-acid-binding protein